MYWEIYGTGERGMTMAVRAAATRMVRVDGRTHARLTEIAREQGRTMQEVIAAAVEAAWREHFVAMANADYAALERDDPAGFAALQAEYAALDGAVGDGLSSDPYPLDEEAR